jgi:hypothetical protein
MKFQIISLTYCIEKLFGDEAAKGHAPKVAPAAVAHSRQISCFNERRLGAVTGDALKPSTMDSVERPQEKICRLS